MGRPKTIPPDLKRCQGEHREGSFMSFGIPPWVRCKNKPVMLAKENRPREDGCRGTMSLCSDCMKVMIDKLGADYATLTPIKQKGKRNATR